MDGKYWDRAWSLVDGCTPCSPGCEHCWSAAMTHRFENKKKWYDQERGFISLTDNCGKFSGQIIYHPERLSIPRKRRKPAVYAGWNDAYHENVPPEFLDEIYKTMAHCPQHTFLLLTKRPKRALQEYGTCPYPPPHIWHGLTVCNQQEADEKIPVFLQVPGRKFLSIEPMLGAVDLTDALSLDCERCQSCGRLYREVWKADDLSWAHVVNKYGAGMRCPDCFEREAENAGVIYEITISGIIPCIDAVILGGETGPGARPMHPDWVRSVRDQCAAAGVPFFFKGWGEFLLWEELPASLADGRKHINVRGGEKYRGVGDFARVGKKNAGRLLDGRTHDDLPWRKT